MIVLQERSIHEESRVIEVTLSWNTISNGSEKFTALLTRSFVGPTGS